MTYQEWLGFMQQYLQSVEKYSSIYSGQQIDTAVGKALNPDTTPTASSSALITSSAVKSAIDNVACRPNLLDNWYFVGGGSQQGGGQFPINQRGQTTYNGQVYGVDRWLTSNESAVVTVASGYLGFKSEVFGNLVQKMENPSQYAGKTLTLSVLFDGTSHNDAVLGAQFTSGYNQSVAKDTFNSFTFTVPSDDGLRYIFIQSLNASYTYHIVAAKLEVGNTQTLAHQENGVWVLNDPAPNYQQELAKCQRYYQKISVGGIIGIGGPDVIYFRAPLLCKMRETYVSVTQLQAVSYRADMTTYSSTSCDSMQSTGTVVENAVDLTANASGVSQGKPYIIVSAQVALSADL